MKNTAYQGSMRVQSSTMAVYGILIRPLIDGEIWYSDHSVFLEKAGNIGLNAKQLHSSFTVRHLHLCELPKENRVCNLFLDCACIVLCFPD